MMKVHRQRTPKLPKPYNEHTFKVYLKEICKTACGKVVGQKCSLVLCFDSRRVTCKVCKRAKVAAGVPPSKMGIKKQRL